METFPSRGWKLSKIEDGKFPKWKMETFQSRGWKLSKVEDGNFPKSRMASFQSAEDGKFPICKGW